MPDVTVAWTPFALRCLDEIHYFISSEAQSSSPANKFTDKIFTRTNQLATFPESGQEDTFLRKRGIHARYLVEGNFKIVYEYLPSKKLVVILDIFRTSQNPSKIIKR